MLYLSPSQSPKLQPLNPPRKQRLNNIKTILGIDEVGRGPWAGPLVIGAVILGPNRPEWQELTDSKKLTAKQRERFNPLILRYAAATGLGWVSAAEIDQYGLSNSLRLATNRAVKQILQTKIPFDEIIIDGTVNFLAHTPLAARTTTLKKADLLVKEVSAASIIAKVARDHYMIELADRYPVYGFENHVGYGAAAHRQALITHGVCPEHRRSFRPIQAIITSRETNYSDNFSQPSPSESFELTLPSNHDTTATGQRGEYVVLNYLVQQEHRIIAHNYKTPTFEIDLISSHGNHIYFTEVKYRQTATHGDALAQVTPQKLQQMQFAAQSFLAAHPEFHEYQPVLAVGAVSGSDFQLDQWFTLSDL